MMIVAIILDFDEDDISLFAKKLEMHYPKNPEVNGEKDLKYMFYPGYKKLVLTANSIFVSAFHKANSYEEAMKIYIKHQFKKKDEEI